MGLQMLLKLLLALAIPLWSQTACGQVLARLDLSPTKASAPTVGRGESSYTWDLYVCPIGPLPVQFDELRYIFPEIRLYSRAKQEAVLAQRVSQSLPALFVKWGGRFTEIGGVALQAETALKKSPSQVGTAVTVGGLGMQLAVAWASKDVPKYVISNPVPDVIALKSCADFTALAAYGKAPVTIGPRRVDPLGGVKP